MEKGGDLPINCGFGASQEKWSNLRSIIIPTPLPLREKSQKRGRLHCTRVKFAPVGGWEVGLWESLGLLPLTWFDPHGPMPRGHIFWEPNKSGAGFRWLKSNYLAHRGFSRFCLLHETRQNICPCLRNLVPR